MRAKRIEVTAGGSTYEVHDGRRWWVAFSTKNGDWSITNGPRLTEVSASGALGKQIIKAVEEFEAAMMK